jgi:transcriptional regulator with XRE-family HTH domain
LKDVEKAIAVQLGANVRRCRKAAGLTQERLAALTGLHRTEVGLVEAGKRVMRTTTLLRCLGALGAEPEELFRGIAWVPSEEPDSPAGRFVIEGAAPWLEPLRERDNGGGSPSG